MKKVRIIPILIVLLWSMVFFSCLDEQLNNNMSTEDAVVVTRNSEEPDSFLDYLLSPDFGEQIIEIGIEKIEADGLNLQVIDRYTVIQTDPYDPSDFDIDPADPDPPNIVVKIYSEGNGNWPFLKAGIYFWDTESGWIYDVWGHIVNLDLQVPPW